MKKAAFIILILFPFFNPLFGVAQSQSFKPSFSANFDSKNGGQLLRQCSRAVPADVSDYWELQQSDIESLERNFHKIDTLTSRDCCLGGGRVGRLKNYGFQYVGVLVAGRKYVYINAFPLSMLKEYKDHDPNFDASKQPVMVCDGGSSFWGALFDVETKEFSHLSFNGVG